MLSKAEARKAEHLQQVVGYLHERLPGDKAVHIEPFLRQYYARVAPDDLLAVTVQDLFGAALALWRRLQCRAPGAAKVRVFNPRHDDHGWQSPHTVVEVINDDMPFLVDSVTADLNRHDAMIHLIIHPVLHVRRDASGNLIELLGAGCRGRGGGRRIGDPCRGQPEDPGHPRRHPPLARGGAEGRARRRHRLAADAGEAGCHHRHIGRGAAVHDSAGGLRREPGVPALGPRQSFHPPRLSRVRPGREERRDRPRRGAGLRPRHHACPRRSAGLHLVRSAAARGAGPRPPAQSTDHHQG
ncbi:MAG: hypothetical protein EXQ96_09820 [Alphaproteobacteria bacterium]|nr:hypothetical protein [Alphaproteobacteria bacterium]